mgnify:CR=1 FL=1
MLNNCDLIVCDGLGIEKYINDKYPKLSKKTVYIKNIVTVHFKHPYCICLAFSSDLQNI